MKQEYSELFKIYPEARKEVVELIKSGASTGELSKCLGVTRQCLYNWISTQLDIDNLDKDPEFQSAKAKLYKVVSDLEDKSPKERKKEEWYAKRVLGGDRNLKKRIVGLVERQGHSVADVSRQVGVVATNPTYWRSELRESRRRSSKVASNLKKFRDTLKKFKD